MKKAINVEERKKELDVLNKTDKRDLPENMKTVLYMKINKLEGLIEGYEKAKKEFEEIIDELSFKCLSDFAYSGGDIPKTFLKELHQQDIGYNKCKKELKAKLKEEKEK